MRQIAKLKFLPLTLADAAANLALDEALLEQAADSGMSVLRLWEPATHFVVVGRGSQIQQETDRETCRALQIPVLRRASGGAAIVAGPGCLMYAVVLHLPSPAAWRDVQRIHDEVMSRHVAALASLGIPAQRQGTCDLTVGDRKISGNSLRCVRGAVLYHGTFLYDFQLSLISRCLRMPPRMPEYRARRGHDEFVGQLAVQRSDLEGALRRAWCATDELIEWPRARTETLACTKYRVASWIESGRIAP